MCIQVNVHLPRGGEKIFDVCDTKEQLKTTTVHQLKQKVAKDLDKADDFRLVCGSMTLEDGATLEFCGIRHMSVIQMVLRLSGGF